MHDMVLWYSVLAHGIAGPIFLKDAVNAAHYINILKKTLSHSCKAWVSILRRKSFNRTWLCCMHQMQC